MAAATVALATIAAGSLIHQIESGKQAKREASRAANYAQIEQDRATAKLETQRKEEETAQSRLAQRQAAVKRKRDSQPTLNTHGGTLLTSPLGLPGGASGAAKTLLGS